MGVGGFLKNVCGLGLKTPPWNLRGTFVTLMRDVQVFSPILNPGSVLGLGPNVNLDSPLPESGRSGLEVNVCF